MGRWESAAGHGDEVAVAEFFSQGFGVGEIDFHLGAGALRVMGLVEGHLEMDFDADERGVERDVLGVGKFVGEGHDC